MNVLNRLFGSVDESADDNTNSTTSSKRFSSLRNSSRTSSRSHRSASPPTTSGSPRPSTPDKVVDFSVGGQVFSTRASTLRCESESLFAALADVLHPGGGPNTGHELASPPNAATSQSRLRPAPEIDVTLDGGGRVFIDRDPAFLPLILKYLRATAAQHVFTLSDLGAPERGTKEFAELVFECRFYRLPGLLSMLDDEKASVDVEPLTSNSMARVSTPPVRPSFNTRRSGLQQTEESQGFGARRTSDWSAGPPRQLQNGFGTDLWRSDNFTAIDGSSDDYDSNSSSSNIDVGEKALQQLLVQQMVGGSDKSATRHQAEMDRLLEQIKLEDQKERYARAKATLERKNTGKSLKYNMIVVGVTGTGKSSLLNTLVGRPVCKVAGSQAQGTRGCVLKEGAIMGDSFCSFIDTQGLGADTSINDAELLSNIMLATESILKLRLINNIIISYDLNTRATPATMANQLTLVELFAELKGSCFLAFTKWNTPAVQAEWNHPLRLWVRRWRRATTVDEITDAPPSYEVMYQAYCAYIVASMANQSDGGAFGKMASFLAFFDARVLWMFNLDESQEEDRSLNELEPHIQVLYKFYRDRCLNILDIGSTVIDTRDLSLLRSGEEVMHAKALELIKRRDMKIERFESAGMDFDKNASMKSAFEAMADETAQRIGLQDFAEVMYFGTKIAQIAGIVHSLMIIGCVIS